MRGLSFFQTGPAAQGLVVAFCTLTFRPLMKVIDIRPEVFAALDAQRDMAIAKQALDRITSLMTPEWVAAMDAKLASAMRGNASAVSRLKKITDVMDEVAKVREPHVVCKAGCSACCHMQVEMTDVEAERISRATGTRSQMLAPGRHTTPVEKLGRKDTPCPFLKNNQCSIYDVRPVMCRDMAITGPDALACSFENMALFREKDPRAILVPQTKMNPALAAWASIVQARRSTLADIRQFFP